MCVGVIWGNGWSSGIGIHVTGSMVGVGRVVAVIFKLGVVNVMGSMVGGGSRVVAVLLMTVLRVMGLRRVCKNSLCGINACCDGDLLIDSS